MKILISIGLINLIFCSQLASSNLLASLFNPQISSLLQATNIRPPVPDTYVRPPGDEEPSYSSNSAQSLYGNLCSRRCEDRSRVFCTLKKHDCRGGIFGIIMNQWCPKTCGLCPKCPLSAQPCVSGGKCKDRLSSCFFMSRKCNTPGAIGEYAKQTCPVSCRVCRPCPETTPPSLPTRCLRTCKDDHQDCINFANTKGYCAVGSKYESWMKINCKKSCGLCKVCPSRRPPSPPQITNEKPTLPPLPAELLALIESENTENNDITTTPMFTKPMTFVHGTTILPLPMNPINIHNQNEMTGNPMYPNQKPMNEKQNAKKPELIGFSPIGYVNKEDTAGYMHQAGHNSRPMTSNMGNMGGKDYGMKETHHQGMNPTNIHNQMSGNSMYHNQKPTDEIQTAKKPDLIGFSPIGYVDEKDKGANSNSGHMPTASNQNGKQRPMGGSFGSYHGKMPMKPMHHNNQARGQIYGENPNKKPMKGSRGPNNGMMNNGPGRHHNRERSNMTKPVYGRHPGPMHGKYPNMKPTTGMMNNGPGRHHNREGSNMTKPVYGRHPGPMQGKYPNMKPTTDPMMKPGYGTNNQHNEERCKMMMSDSDSKMDQCVNVHNYYRCLHGASPLEFDSYLAASAQEYAERLSMEQVTMESLMAKTLEIGDDLNMIMMKTSNMMKQKMMKEEMMEESDMSEGNMMEMMKQMMSEGTDMMSEERMQGLGMTDQQMIDQLRILEEMEMDGETTSKQKKMADGTDMMKDTNMMEGKDMMGQNMMEGTDMMKENMTEGKDMMGQNMMEGTDMMGENMMEGKDMMGRNMMEGSRMNGDNMKNGGLETSYRRTSRSSDMTIGVNVGISAASGMKYGIRQALIDWYAESLKYMYERTDTLMASKRFTQLVWKNTTRVGCGMYKMGDKMIVVAHYSTKGNIPEKYHENVADMEEGCSSNCTMGSCLSIKGDSSACQCINAGVTTSVPACRKRCVITCRKPSYFKGPWQYSCQGAKLCSCSHRGDSSNGYLAGAWCK